MSWSTNKKSITRWLRIIHRDLGYLMVGICLVYGISGMLLNHLKGKNPAYKVEQRVLNFETGLSNEEFSAQWESRNDLPRLKRILPMEDNQFRITMEGGVGTYNKSTGVVEYERSAKRPFVYWINKLHYNQVKGWSLMADFFAVSLIFFAVSGLFMVKGKKGIAGRGKWFLLIGILIPVAYVILT